MTVLAKGSVERVHRLCAIGSSGSLLLDVSRQRPHGVRLLVALLLVVVTMLQREVLVLGGECVHILA